MSKVLDNVGELLKPILDEHHFDLYDLKFVSEGGKWYLRIYIDKPAGITIDDCALISDELGEKLDQADPDPIPQAYYLEVSSPGAERPLRNEREYKEAIGKYIHISLYAPIKGNKIYEGTLQDYDGNRFLIQYNDMSVMRNLEIPKKSVAKARLAIKF